jgi:hypothetical protein
MKENNYEAVDNPPRNNKLDPYPLKMKVPPKYNLSYHITATVTT